VPRTPHWFTRRRERRYAKRQLRRERDYFQRRRARETLTPEVSPNAYQHTSGFWFWVGIGGDGGGGGADGGGGGV
jgi:hypothetical protein